MDKTIVRPTQLRKDNPFLFSTAWCGILVMQKVAQKIKRPVYGVQDTPEAPITGTLDHLSGFYLSKIKERQPLGPYLIGGFSFGGWPSFGSSANHLHRSCSLQETCLAVKIAQILQAEGAKVETLILLDGAPTLFHRPMFCNYIKSRSRTILFVMTCVIILTSDSSAHDNLFDGQIMDVIR